MLAKLALSSFLLIQALYLIQTDKQEVYLYDGPNQTTSRFYMWSRKNEADLSDYPSLNITGGYSHRICNIGGLTLYTGADFSGVGSFLNYTNDIACNTLAPTGYKSFRFAGLMEDASALTLNFYNETNFRGPHTIVTGNLTNITFPFASIYKTGDYPWSIYLKPDYEGFSHCISTDVVINIATLGILPGEVQSAKLGCGV